MVRVLKHLQLTIDNAILFSVFIALSIVQTQRINVEKPCKLNKGDEGECVPYYLVSKTSKKLNMYSNKVIKKKRKNPRSDEKIFQCNNGSIITDGANLLDIRNGVGPKEECDDYLEQCCAIADIDKELSMNLIPNGYKSNGMGGVVPITNADSGIGCDGIINGHLGSKSQHKCGVRHEKGIGFSLAGEGQRESEFGKLQKNPKIHNN